MVKETYTRRYSENEILFRTVELSRNTSASPEISASFTITVVLNLFQGKGVAQSLVLSKKPVNNK